MSFKEEQYFSDSPNGLTGTPMPDQITREALRQGIASSIAIDEASGADFSSTLDGIMSLIDQYTAEHERLAQENAVAWAVGVIDDFHGMPHEYSSERDKFYKGVKNGLRDRYRSENGVDPAPNYPITANLTNTKKEGV